MSACSGGGAETEALVEEVNAGRRAKYAEVAGKRSAPVAAVAQIAGKKLIERAPAGSYVMGADGTWRQKEPGHEAGRRHGLPKVGCRIRRPPLPLRRDHHSRHRPECRGPEVRTL
jgi:hypothetical protein